MTIGIPTTALSSLRSCCALTNVRAPCRPKARYQGEGHVLQEVCSHKTKETPAAQWDYVSPLLSNKYILSSILLSIQKYTAAERGIVSSQANALIRINHTQTSTYQKDV